MILEIDAVWCRTHIEFNTIKNDGDYDAVVSYHKIYHRLLKSDPDNNIPSDILISIQIGNEIKKAIRKFKPNDRVKILYMFKDLDPSIINNFHHLLRTMDVDEYFMNLIIVNNKVIKDPSIFKQFNQVIEI